MEDKWENIEWIILQARNNIKQGDESRAMELITQGLERSNRNVESLYKKIDDNTQAKKELLKELKEANKRISMVEKVKEEVEAKQKRQAQKKEFLQEQEEKKKEKRENIKYWISLVMTMIGIMGAMWAFFNFLLSAAT